MDENVNRTQVDLALIREIVSLEERNRKMACQIEALQGEMSAMSAELRHERLLLEMAERDRERLYEERADLRRGLPKQAMEAIEELCKLAGQVDELSGQVTELSEQRNAAHEGIGELRKLIEWYERREKELEKERDAAKERAEYFLAANYNWQGKFEEEAEARKAAERECKVQERKAADLERKVEGRGETIAKCLERIEQLERSSLSDDIHEVRLHVSNLLNRLDELDGENRHMFARERLWYLIMLLTGEIKKD
jgi:chromosome segregation ATPase